MYPLNEKILHNKFRKRKMYLETEEQVKQIFKKKFLKAK